MQLPSGAGSSLPLETSQIGDNPPAAGERKALLGSQSPPSQGGAPQAQPGASPAPPPQGAPPSQPPPRQPLTQADMQPGGKVFMQPQLTPAPSWRQQLRVWAQHPEARVIRQLSQRADAGLKNKPDQQ